MRTRSFIINFCILCTGIVARLQGVFNKYVMDGWKKGRKERKEGEREGGRILMNRDHVLF